jgi:hypothetical protein
MTTAVAERRARVAEVVDAMLVGPAVEFCWTRARDCEVCFLAGSFARGTFDPLLPNVNLYFIAAAGRGPELRLGLAAFYDDARDKMRARGFELALDCHPYTIVSRPPEPSTLPQIVVTTKVMENRPDVPRLSLPPTIGVGWLTAHRVLWGPPDALEHLRLTVRTDLGWFQALQEALTRYRNLLDHLPWAVPWRAKPRLLVEESLRYAEEALREALPVGLTEAELAAGLQFALYHKWDDGTSAFLRERYGEPGRWMNGAVRDLKEEFATDRAWTVEEAEAAWRTALQVWEIVWRAFCRRVREERPNEADWLTRVNAFV